MRIKTIFTGMAALLLLSMAWKYQDAESVQSFLASQRPQSQPTIQFDNDAQTHTAPATEMTRAGGRTGVSGVRKCRKGEQVIYTDGECPSGSREHAVNGGSVTVVPAQRSVPSPELPSASERPGSGLPNARELLRPDDGQARLRDQAMERVINR